MKKIIVFLLIILLIPLFIIGIDNKDINLKNMYYGIYSNKKIKVKMVDENKIEEIPLEKYVLGVVAGEMPASFDNNALKAQAVASRTYALNKAQKNNEYDVTNTTKDQVYITDDQMKEKWKDNYENNLKKLTEIVKETQGEVILYNNELIDAMFFSTSNGYTENSEDVFSSALPYLKSVESKWDETESPVFKSTNKISKQEFLSNLGLTNSNEIIIKDIEKTNTGRISSLVINDKKFSSSSIRNIFNLKSTSFNINIDDNYVTFSVSGYGHGVGLSQYGANGMSKQGYDYKKILLYYYKDCEIKKIN